MNTETIAESIGFEPQAFIADPESDVGMFEISNMDLEKLRSGDKSTWDDLAAKLEPIAKSDGETRSLKKSDTSGFIREIEPSRANQEAWDQARQVWDSHGAISPPFEKDLLCRIARMSGVLQECVRTYCTVIEGFGHMFKPVLDPDADDAVQQVKWTMWNRRVELGGDVDLSEPTDEEVQKRLEEISREMQFQKMRAIRFFRNAARIKGQPVGFINLRKRFRQDYEITGEWYIEILRDLNGNIRRLSYLPSVGMRQMPLDNEMIAVKVKERADDFHVVEQIEHRRFRRYLQVDPDQSAQAYFKEFGDPRILSSVSGRYYQTVDDLEKYEPGVMAATEVLTDGIPDPETPYGVARWTANSPAIGGSRKSEEVNFAYFDNKTIPPFIILVSGGRLSSHAQERIKTYLRALKGSENFHKLLVLEAAPFAANMPGQPPQRVQIEVVPLIKFMQDDGLFLKYLAFNDTRIGANFACPPLLRGRSDDYNRATSRESLRFFEKLVAEPERMHFDELLNTRLMMALGLTLVKFESLGSDTSDPEVTSRVLDVLLNHGAILPIDGRQEAERLLRRELPKVTDPFMYRPLKLSVSEMATRANVPGQEQLSSTLINEETAEEDFNQNNTENVQMADDLDVSYINSLRKQIKSDLDAFGRDTIWTGIEK